MPGRNIGVFTYNGLDGACAAAAVLLKYPDAKLTVTSARRVAGSLEDALNNRAGALSRLYICGLGVKCEPGRLSVAAAALQRRGTEVVWYCGRGYLDTWRDLLAGFCTPVFSNQGTNTAAVCRHHGLERSKAGRRLMDLALLDQNLETPASGRRCTGDQRFWVDLVEAAVSRYFKYQERQAYKNAIRSLTSGRADEAAVRLVEVYRRHGAAHALRGKSEAMKHLRERISLIAETGEHVLITGESGVGKEYVARLIQEAGPRSMEPVVTVNCAVFAGSEALANSTLFGHVRGAFTGASQDRPGAFAAADGGVLFLDEVGELPLSVQGKFLRVIEDGLVTPVGCDRPAMQADVQVIAATNRSLPQMVEKGSFREDLFHRLDVLRLYVPPLREHPDDIAEIAEHLLRNDGGLAPNDSLPAGDRMELGGYEWPGNVRQLRKVLKRSRTLGIPLKDVIQEERIYLEPGRGSDDLMPSSPLQIKDIRIIQHRYALQSYRINSQRLGDTARRLNISPNTLRKHLNAPPGTDT